MSNLRKFIDAYNNMLTASPYTNEGRVQVFLDTNENFVVVYCVNHTKIVDICDMNEFGVYLALNDAIKEMY